MKDDLKKLVGENEKILYEGKPNKKCFIFESVFNPLLPFALLWAAIDFGIVGGSIFSGGSKNILIFLIPFMLLHLMPVWIYLGGALFSFKKYKNTNYIVTDNAIYVSEGIFSKRFNTKPFAELSHVDLNRGIFDQMFNVGDIITTTSQFSSNNTAATICIKSISNYMEVYNIIKKLQKDIYTDVMYPNDKRPKENHGYNTEYKG
jgi:membrane protein YdbS with pleckstrin-like domain